MSKLFKRLDHLGYACHDIQKAIDQILVAYPISSISNIVFDEYQNASLCYLTCKIGPNIELISGSAVKDILSKGLSLYHTCYEVDNIDYAIEKIRQQGGILIKAPYPAPLFNNRKVAFLETNLGLVEILETQHSTVQPPTSTICISGTFSLDLVKNGLIKLQQRLAWNLEVVYTDYNQVLQTLYDPTSKFYKNSSGYNIILLRIEDCLRYVDIAELTQPKLQNLLQQYAQKFIAAVNHASAAGVSIIIAWCPKTSNFSIELEHAINATEKEILVNLNKNVIHWEDLLQDFRETIYDSLSDKIASIPYTETANHALACTILRRLHALTRRPYKVIIVDCDNTLWLRVILLYSRKNYTENRRICWNEPNALFRCNL